MSGAGRIKHDGSDQDHITEVKLAGRTYQLKAQDLEAVWLDAVRSGKEACFSIYFDSLDITADITITRGRS